MSSSILKSRRPEYRIQLPLSKKRVAYTSFTLGAELVLLTASESGDLPTIISAIINLVNDCINTDGVKADDLPQAEAELLLYNMRAKSTDRRVEIVVTDPENEDKKYNHTIDLSKLEITVPEDFSDTVELSDGRIVHMRIPSMRTQIEIAELQEGIEDLSTEESVMVNLRTVLKCIKAIEIDDEVHMTSAFEEDELLEFLKDLERADGMRLFNFVGTLPYVRAEIKVKREDGTSFTTEVRDMATFL